MDIQIEKPNNPILRKSIESFIFSKVDKDKKFSYTTFPNTNLCLSIYEKNDFQRVKSDSKNNLRIFSGGDYFSSQLFGFHKMPFNVDIEGKMNQVSILFKASGIHSFADFSFENLESEANVFEILFPNSLYFFEGLFKQRDINAQKQLLENFLIENYKPKPFLKRLNWGMEKILQTGGSLKIKDLSEELNCNTSTIFRYFKRYVGQNPKDFAKTVRFRKCLAWLTNPFQRNLTELTYSNSYFDQSHFIKDFKKLSGMTPFEFKKNYRIENKQLIWVVDK